MSAVGMANRQNYPSFAADSFNFESFSDVVRDRFLNENVLSHFCSRTNNFQVSVVGCSNNDTVKAGGLQHLLQAAGRLTVEVFSKLLSLLLASRKASGEFDKRTVFGAVRKNIRPPTQSDNAYVYWCATHVSP